MTPAVVTEPEVSVSIRIEKEYHKFSAAHFLIFEDGTAERLHGHNYRVGADVASAGTTHGMVVDFRALKPRIGAIVDSLDERLILPGEHPGLTIETLPDDELQIRYGRRRYIVPADEVVVLPITNTSSENLARWIAERLLDSIRDGFPGLELTSLEVSVEETPGQRGIARLTF